MTLRDLQNDIDQWITTVGVRYFSELTNLAVLMEEVGEFSRLVARKYGEQNFKNPEDNRDIDHNLKEELADIIFVSCCLANQMGIDLTEAMKANIDKKRKRDKTRHLNNPKLKS